MSQSGRNLHQPPETAKAAQSTVTAFVGPDFHPPEFNFWADLVPAEAAQLRDRLVPLTVGAGGRFICCGEPDECLYLVESGEVEVRRDGRLLARFGRGHVVGEMALLNREPRNADVVALTDCQLWRLNAGDFESLGAQLPQLKLLLTRLVAHRLNWSGADVVARHIGPYQVVAELGRGNMGWVFRAVHEGATYALKMLPHPQVQRPRFLELYRNEARLLRLLRHANIVSLFEAIELYGTMFLVLEFINGTNAQTWVEQSGPPSIADVRCIAQSVTRALQAAHAHGIIHRDVKPGNVMINTAGVVKLVDFGIAIARTDAPHTTELALTPRYAAPEQFAGSACGPETDFYSLGVMIYELLSGQAPFTGDSLTTWERAHRHAVPAPLTGAGVPEDLRNFVEAALIKEPARRRAAVAVALQPWAACTSPLALAVPPAVPACSARV